MYKLICGVLIVLAGLVFAQGEPNAQPGAVLVVDLGKIVDKCDEAIDKLNALEAEAVEASKKYAAKVNEVRLKQESLAKQTQLADHDEAYYKAIEELVQEMGFLKSKEQAFIARQQDKIVRRTAALWMEAREISHAIMKKRGAQMVMVSRTGRISFENQKQSNDELVFRRVLAIASADQDITGDVMAEMNNRYKARLKAGGGGAKPGGGAKGGAKNRKDAKGGGAKGGAKNK